MGKKKALVNELPPKIYSTKALAQKNWPGSKKIPLTQ
jgi:hypothetical protein